MARVWTNPVVGSTTLERSRPLPAMTPQPKSGSSGNSGSLEAAPEFRVALDQAGVAEILSAVERMALTGTLSVSRGITVKELTVAGGELQHAASTDLRDSLGAYLERSGTLDAETVRAHAEGGGRGLRLGERLVDANVLSPGEVRRSIRGQMRAMVLSLFEWIDGEASFLPGATDRTSGVGGLPLRPLIYEGILNSSDPGRILTTIGGPDRVLRPVHRPEDSIRLDLDPTDLEFLRSVDGSIAVEELAASGPYMYADNLRRLYAFALLGLLEMGDGSLRDAAPEGFRVRITRPSETPAS